MPLSTFQRRVLAIIAGRRTSESYIAGGSPITSRSTRFSVDLDIFNDREALVQPAAEADEAALAADGLSLTWLRRLPSIWTAAINGGPEPLRLDWAHDAAFRFFPARADTEFGYVLHPVDLMTNKVLAAAGRSAARDLVDIVSLADIVPIGAAIIAAVGKDPGMPPETVMDHMSMFGRHQQSAFDSLRSTERIEGPRVQRVIQDALASTRTIVERLPAIAFGKLYYEQDKIVVPDPDKLATYRVRMARQGGLAPRLENAPVRAIAERYDDLEP